MQLVGLKLSNSTGCAFYHHAIDRVLKKRDITLSTKAHIVKVVVFPVAHVQLWESDIKKAEHQIDAFEVWCWRRVLRVSWTARRSNQSILKEINLEYSLEGLMLKLTLQNFGHLMWKAHWKRPWHWEILRAGGEGAAENEMVGWHHQLNGHEF